MAEAKFQLKFTAYNNSNSVAAPNVNGAILITVVTGDSAITVTNMLTGETQNYYQITGKCGENTVWITSPSSAPYCKLSVCHPLSYYAVSGSVVKLSGGTVNGFGTLTVNVSKPNAYVRTDYVNALNNVEKLSPYILYNNIGNRLWNHGTAMPKYQKGYALTASTRMIGFDSNGNSMTTGAYAKQYVTGRGLNFVPNLPTVGHIYDYEPEDAPATKTLRFYQDLTGVTIVNSSNSVRTVYFSVAVNGTDKVFELSETVPVGTTIYPITFSSRFWNNLTSYGVWCNVNVSGSSSRNAKMVGTEDGSAVTFNNDYGGEGYHSAQFDHSIGGVVVINSITLTITSQSK